MANASERSAGAELASAPATKGAEVGSCKLMAGCWAVYSYNYGEEIESVYMTELAALRVINQRGYGHVKFLKWGELSG